MTKEKAKEILGDRPQWELKQMKKALTILPFFNDEKDNERLEAVKIMLKENK